MTTEFQHEQRARRETLRNDARLREQQQATSMHQFAQSQANDTGGGRFGALGNPNITGSTPVQQIPQLPSSSPWSGAQPEPGIEPALGYEVNRLTPYELEPSVSSLAAAQATEGAPVPEAPSSGVHLPADDVESSAGAPSSSEQTK
jgi:hypothetical protein